jgi:hypothetical protein
MQRYEEKTERQNIPIKILSKSACVIILFSFVYSIGRIINSMNRISSSVRAYFAGNAETGTCFAQSISPKKIEWLGEIYLNKDGKNEGVGKTRRQYQQKDEQFRHKTWLRGMANI